MSENKNSTQAPDNKSDERKKKDLKWKIISIVAIIIIILLLLLRSCQKEDIGIPDSKPTFDITTGDVVDPNNLSDAERIQAELNRQVADGMMTISMNANPVFETPTSEGNLLIVNEYTNKYPQIVEIYNKENDELIYTSKGIPIGKKLEMDSLDVKLPTGEHPCTAYFIAVDPETKTEVGRAGADIIITIK